MTLRLAALAGVLVAVLASPAFADPISDGVAALPGAVEDVRIAGTWEKGSDTGSYRIVIARGGVDAITARLFIQWIALDDSGEAVVANTIEVKELQDLGLDIADYTTQSDADGLTVFIQTLNPNSGAEEHYELFVLSPTEYRFGLATN